MFFSHTMWPLCEAIVAAHEVEWLNTVANRYTKFFRPAKRARFISHFSIHPSYMQTFFNG